MYYEEKLIDGILHWRGTPDGGWQIIPAEKLSERVTAAEAFRATVAEALAALKASIPHDPIDRQQVLNYIDTTIAALNLTHKEEQ